jgi:hypothetical protein
VTLEQNAAAQAAVTEFWVVENEPSRRFLPSKNSVTAALKMCLYSNFISSVKFQPEECDEAILSS